MSDSLWPLELRHTRLPFTLSWSLLRLMSTESVMLSNHLILCLPLLLLAQSFPASSSFQWVSSLCQVAKVGASASASVLLMNIQDWFPLGLAGLISLQFKGLSGASSSTTIQKHQLAFSLLYGPALTSIHDYWKNHSFDYMDLCWQSDVSAF